MNQTPECPKAGLREEAVLGSTLEYRQAAVFSIGAAAAFQLAYCFASASFLIAAYLYCLVGLSRLKPGRHAIYFGLGTGLLSVGPQLGFFWYIFGPASIALWCVLAFWIGLFVSLARLCRLRFGNITTALFLPFLWTGLEYFRSELYYLRFSWLNAGFALSETLQWLPLKYLGVYGIGFTLMLGVSLLGLLQPAQRIPIGLGLLGLLAVLTNFQAKEKASPTQASVNLSVAGVQLEFPTESEAISAMDKLIKSNPEAKLLVLSEYTFDGPVPQAIKDWCRKHGRHLIIGAKDPVAASQYYDTVFVIGPDGEIVFRQAKCVPIQFFKDGLPAREQKVWKSPWGMIGFCVCYDLSYSRVTDELVRLGAQALIVPTMDLVDWGRHQHELHARVAPIRAAEYGIPIFRLASSGISQCVNAWGQTIATAPFPGEAASISARLDLDRAGRLPWDRVLAPASVIITALIAAWFSAVTIKRKFSPRTTT